jgi:DNA-binding MltR family transcriptional regulator
MAKDSSRIPNQPLDDLFLIGDNHLGEVLLNTNPVACVITSVAFLEQCLAAALERFALKGSGTAQDLLTPGNLLGELMGRGKVAYVFGIISSEAWSNIQEIARIRNRFAHSHLKMDFNDIEVQKLIRKLNQHPFFGSLPDPVESQLDSALIREYFIAAVSATSHDVMLGGRDLEHRQPARSWVWRRQEIPDPGPLVAKND